MSDDNDELMERVALEYLASHSQNEFEREANFSNPYLGNIHASPSDKLNVERIVEEASSEGIYAVDTDFEKVEELGDNYFSMLKKAKDESMFLTREIYEQVAMTESSLTGTWLRVKNGVLESLFRKKKVTERDVLQRLIENSEYIGQILGMVIGHSFKVRNTLYGYVQKLAGKFEMNEQEYERFQKKFQRKSELYRIKEMRADLREYGEGKGYLKIIALDRKKTLEQERMKKSQYEAHRVFAEQEIPMFESVIGKFDRSTREAILGYRYIENITRAASRMFEVYQAKKEQGRLMNMSRDQLKELAGSMIGAYQSITGFLGDVNLVYRSAQKLGENGSLTMGNYMSHAKEYVTSEKSKLEVKGG